MYRTSKERQRKVFLWDLLRRITLWYFRLHCQTVWRSLLLSDEYERFHWKLFFFLTVTNSCVRRLSISNGLRSILLSIIKKNKILCLCFISVCRSKLFIWGLRASRWCTFLLFDPWYMFKAELFLFVFSVFFFCFVIIINTTSKVPFFINVLDHGHFWVSSWHFSAVRA